MTAVGMKKWKMLVALLLVTIVVSLLIVLFVHKYSAWIHRGIIEERFAGVPVVELGGDMPQPGPALPAGRELPDFRMAIAPIISPEASLLKYRDFAAYLGQQLGQPGKLVLRSTYEETNKVLENRECELALVCTYPFLLGERKFGMQALVVPVQDGNQYFRSYLIVPANSPARTLLDLRGKKFALADIYSLSGWQFPALWLKQRHENPRTFFSKQIVSGSHDRSIISVANGYADGAAVHSGVYRQTTPAIRDRTRIIMESEPFGQDPICVHPGMPRERQARLRAILTGMHETEAGRAILTALGIDRFVVPDQQLYDSARAIVRAGEAAP